MNNKFTFKTVIQLTEYCECHPIVGWNIPSFEKEKLNLFYFVMLGSKKKKHVEWRQHEIMKVVFLLQTPTARLPERERERKKQKKWLGKSFKVFHIF